MDGKLIYLFGLNVSKAVCVLDVIVSCQRGVSVHLIYIVLMNNYFIFSLVLRRAIKHLYVNEGDISM